MRDLLYSLSWVRRLVRNCNCRVTCSSLRVSGACGVRRRVSPSRCSRTTSRSRAARCATSTGGQPTATRSTTSSRALSARSDSEREAWTDCDSCFLFSTCSLNVRLLCYSVTRLMVLLFYRLVIELLFYDGRTILEVLARGYTLAQYLALLTPL